MPSNLPASPDRHAETALPARLAQSLARHLDEPLFAGNRIALLHEGPGALRAAIDAATDHVNLERGIVPPAAEAALAEHLAARCRAGVRVNVLADGAPDGPAARDAFAPLRGAHGATVAEPEAASRWRPRWPGAEPSRSEGRLLVVDGRHGYVVGLGADAGTAGLQLGIDGPVVHRLQRLFVSRWQRRTSVAMQHARYFPPLAPAGLQRLAIAAGEPGRAHERLDAVLLAALANAGRAILLGTASRALPAPLVQALTAAAGRGVAVDVLVPGHGAGSSLLDGGRAAIAQLLQAGVSVHERRGGTDALQHAKACLVDAQWCSLGALPAERRLGTNAPEAALMVLDDAFARDMAQHFHAALAQAEPLDGAHAAGRPPWRHLTERLARHFEIQA